MTLKIGGKPYRQQEVALQYPTNKIELKVNFINLKIDQHENGRISSRSNNTETVNRRQNQESLINITTERRRRSYKASREEEGKENENAEPKNTPRVEERKVTTSIKQHNTMNTIMPRDALSPTFSANTMSDGEESLAQ